MTIRKTDSELKHDVTRELAHDSRIDETSIGVSAHCGVVTLTGTVTSWTEKHTAEQAAHRVTGVLDVANEIEIKQCWSTTKTDADIALAVRSALAKHPMVPAESILSTVADHGSVTLTGAARSISEREEAEAAVRNVEGVRYVTNEIAVEGPRIAAPALQDAIRSALQRQGAREAERITIAVEGDTVVLSGTVDSWVQRRAAVGAVKGMHGVKRIEDRLRIE